MLPSNADLPCRGLRGSGVAFGHRGRLAGRERPADRAEEGPRPRSRAARRASKAGAGRAPVPPATSAQLQEPVAASLGLSLPDWEGGNAAGREAGNAALRLRRISCKTSAARGGSSIDQWRRLTMSVEADAASQAAGSARRGTGWLWRRLAFSGWTFTLGAETERPRRPRPGRAGCGAGTSPIRRRTCRSRRVGSSIVLSLGTRRHVWQRGLVVADDAHARVLIRKPRVAGIVASYFCSGCGGTDCTHGLLGLLGPLVTQLDMPSE